MKKLELCLFGILIIAFAGVAVADIWTIPTTRGDYLGLTVSKNDTVYVCKVKYYSSAREANSWVLNGNLDGQKSYSQYWSQYGSTNPQYFFIRTRSIETSTGVYKARVWYSNGSTNLMPSIVSCEEEEVYKPYISLILGFAGVLCAGLFWWAVIRAST